MPRIDMLRLGRAALLWSGVVAGGIAVSVPANVVVTPAHAQVRAGVSVGDFRVALEPYGTWRRNRRFGDVWIPANLSRDWRPYTAGHWVYTDDYGWYWVADDQEADWGWITYHYGRWYHDRDEGWIWIPNDVWGPAWVDWRYGDQYVGWAPEPPDEFVSEVEDEPTYWSFVTAGDVIAPSIAAVLLPVERRAEFFRRTFVVNRPVMMRGDRDRHFAVNPGIPPSNIAAVRGRPLPSYRVRPHVLAGTAALPGAVQVRAADLGRQREAGNRPGARGRLATRDIVQSTSIKPARAASQLQPLGRGEVGRLGATPPRAARNATVEQRTAQGTPSAQQRGEQRQATSPQRGRESEQRRGNISPPAVPPRTTAQAPAGPRTGTAEQRTTRTPAAGNRSTAQRAPTAQPQPRVSRPPPVAARPPQQAAPPRAVAEPRRPPPAPPRNVAAPQRPAPPRAAAAPPPRPVVPPRAAAAPPPRVAAPPPRAAAAPPPRPAPPPAAAARPPATTGAAPRGGPGPRRPGG